MVVAVVSAGVISVCQISFRYGGKCLTRIDTKNWPVQLPVIYPYHAMPTLRTGSLALSGLLGPYFPSMRCAACYVPPNLSKPQEQDGYRGCRSVAKRLTIFDSWHILAGLALVLLVHP